MTHKLRGVRVEEYSYHHRRSQEGPKGHVPHKFLKNVVILCFQKRFSKKKRYSPKIKRFGPPKFFASPNFGLATPLHIMSTNFAKTLVWKHEYDVKL